MTPITCHSCGRENSPDSRFCQYCGTSILRSQPGAEATASSFPNSAVTSAAESAAGNLNSSLSPGTRLRDRYIVQQQLGQGGFGRTYRAEDTGRFNEIIVLKELTPSVQGTYALKKAEELFQREAATLHRLEHPQIPRFWEIFTDQKRLFLVQDFAAGSTYQQLLEGRQQQGQVFSESEITQLFRDLLPVLSYLHGQGVIHRDISPDNIILRSKDGLPVLIDMGGVKQVAIDVATEVVSGRSSAEALSGGTRLGKIGYAPDEQMRLGLVAPHSDLYALAVTALVLMTGQPPQQLQDPQSLEWLWQRALYLSDNFATVLNKMLAPRPVDRYQAAAEILQALNTQIEPPPTKIMPPPPVASGVPPTMPPASPSTQPAVPPPPTPFSSPPAQQFAAIDDSRKSNVTLWSIAGGLSVAIIGAIVFFSFGNNNNSIDPSVSTLESESPTPSASPRPSPLSSPSPSPSPSPFTGRRRFKSVEIENLETYTHQSNVFSLLVPDGWKSKDNSKPGEVIVLWTDPTGNGGLVADVFDVNNNPNQDELTKLLQDFLKKSFAKEPDFFLREPKPQKDGSVLLIWGYTAQSKTSSNINAKLLGNSFIERQGKRVAILSFIVPDEQFKELEKPLNRIINNYKIDPTIKIP
ncbi:protein kinase [Acaryochloris sp. IP29b_bin.148]|uniref:protein kinase domain-containing protein n=1 Tax=Acaryochloris sp. IP29b_bin.148 TaxID=2969218 RepID=UPI00261303E7|nr:protein kinase [Acaryochloris sp. IP29b_bin.148]